MAKKWQKVTAGVLTGVLAASALAIAPGCGDTLVVNIDPVAGIDYTYRTYTSVSPSNWNELTYEDNNDRQIMGYLQSPFMEFDYQFNDDGTVKEDGTFKVKYSAVTKLEDVTEEMADEWGYSAKQVADGGYAWRFTLRDDLLWDDGTPIYAQDFVYTMKQQLDPLFKNHGAQNYFSGNYVFRNAREYTYQNSYVMEDNYDMGFIISSMSELVKSDDGVYTQAGEDKAGVKFAIDVPLAWVGGYTLKEYEGMTTVEDKDTGELSNNYFDLEALYELYELMDEDGYVDVTDETIALMTTVITEKPLWGETAENLVCYLGVDVWYPECDWSDVGIFSQGTYELVIILDTPLGLLDENKDLTYEAAYYMSSLPLVKDSLYESCKKAPVAGSTLWTTNYCTSLETTASWGPYKLVKFQAGRYYELRRNEKWYGYKDADNDGKYDMYPDQYQTERIVCDTIKSWNTAWQMFRKGGIDGIGIDVTIADDYKDSSRAYFTPDDFIQSMHLQSEPEALKKYEDGSRDNRLFANVKFRQAISLAIDRDDYSATCTTSSLKGLGYFNTMHYYNVAEGGIYRDTQVAKEALLRTYGFVEVSDGQWSINDGQAMTTDEAIEAMTGYNVELARTLVNQAIAEEIENDNWEAGATLKLIWGTAEDTESARRHYNYIKDALTEMFVGTNLAGKFEMVFDGSHGDSWYDDFQAGQYDICTGGWTGGAWNPYYFIGAYIMDSNRYASGWDPASTYLEFTYPGENGDETKNLSVARWYKILNGQDAEINGSSTGWDTDTRLALVAALEETILQTYWSIPVINSFAASLMAHKVDYISYEYNQFMGYGGIQYMTYHYTDAEWKAYVAEQGTLNYKG